MTTTPISLLQDTLRLIDAGTVYFRFASAHAADPEVRDAFAIAAELRALLRRDLATVGPAHGTDTDAEPSAVYTRLKAQFDPHHPYTQGAALHALEQALLRRLEQLFRSHPSPGVRRVVKSAYPGMRRSVETMRRLAQRAAAA